MQRAAAIALCFLLSSASIALADFYRWTDKDGNEFFTNDLKHVPPEYQDDAVPVQPDDSRVNVTDGPASDETAPVTVKEHRDRYGHGEEYWKRRAQNLRLKLRDRQDEYELVLRKIEAEEKKEAPWRGKKKKSNSGLESKRLKLEKEIASLTRELDIELPEEARRADAYPGWIRE